MLINLFCTFAQGFSFSGDIAPMNVRSYLVCVDCLKRDWLCVPLVVEVYDGWGMVAIETFSLIVSRSSYLG